MNNNYLEKNISKYIIYEPNGSFDIPLLGSSGNLPRFVRFPAKMICSTSSSVHKKFFKNFLCLQIFLIL